MIVKQVCAFIENKTGRLSELADILATNGIDISALSLADSTDYGILRMLVSDPEKAVDVMRSAGVVAKITEALAVAIEDAPGGFAKVVSLLSEKNLEVKYMYASVGHIHGKALMILGIDNAADAEKIISQTDAGKIDPAEIYRI
jgi:hypothetical protein